MEEQPQQHWSSGVWPQLLPELAERIAGSLDSITIATSFRVVNKATAAHFSGPEHTTVRISQPVPHHVFAAHWLAPGATRGLTLAQRDKLICLTAASGELDNLGAALEVAGCPPSAALFEALACAGRLALFKILWHLGISKHANMEYILKRALTGAARGGHRHVCEWLLEQNPDAWSWKAVTAAARSGHADLVDWLIPLQMQSNEHQASPTCFKLYLPCAAAHGFRLAALKRFVRRHGWGMDGVFAKMRALESAAGSPTPDWAAKVEWLESKRRLRLACFLQKAAALPKNDAEALLRLTWLHGRGYRLNYRVVVAAARAGNTGALGFALEQVPVPVRGPDGRYGEKDAAEEAGKAGHLAALQALHAAGWLQRSADVAAAAARHGHLHVLAWLLEALGAEAVGLSAGLFAAAAKSGSVELLAWLRQRGCEWDSAAFSAAALAGCVAALEWLAEQGCPMEALGAEAVGLSAGLFAAAAKSGSVELLAWLRQRGCEWDSAAFSAAALAGCVAALEWLAEQGCPMEVGAKRIGLRIALGF
ncbi:hypothetical protein GPECTOR_91g573 [Gonium pectorale]|uniref:Uncharacterized protein n=1 Tax=Gonium pectorale TaxID=33097 RepID=A0A150G0P0_GONPE|nr:hypothetical protein GPECTOR_91g573 [Gonium pectorale]|eukprot:KXZ43419.1 hypothetical protein GPECTOR_91g573 [Gonium pectorale]